MNDDNKLPPGEIAAYADWRVVQDESKAIPHKFKGGLIVYPELGYQAWVKLGRPVRAQKRLRLTDSKKGGINPAPSSSRPEGPVGPTGDIAAERTLNSPIHLAELGMIRDRVQASIDRFDDKAQKRNPLTVPYERAAGAHAALHKLLSESIDPMLEGWRKNEPQSRAAEIILNGEDLDPV